MFTARATSGIAYQPALDGLRAVSVVAVVAFHGQVAGFSGGYLGVSVFFTLSGFLITSLLIAERSRTGTTRVGEFYVRRAKRLLPASLVCLTGISFAAAATDWFAGVDSLRRDLLGALFQVANWVSLAGSGSYQQLFADAGGQVSPVEHYWSLAIEEQFYWLWPLAFAGLYRLLPRSHRSRTVAVVAVTAGFAVAAPLIAAVWGPDAAYWATPARAAEILIGVVAAFVLTGRSLPAWWGWVAMAAFAALGVAVVAFPASGGPAYAGALPVVGVASALLIVGLQVAGPLRTALAAAPLVWLGRISYGVYLYHWPVFVVLDPRRVDLPSPALFLLRVAVTLAIAQVSYVVVERPIRSGVSWRPPAVGVGALTCCIAAAVATVALVPGGGGEYWRRGAVADAAIAPVGDGDLTPLTPLTTVVSAPSAAVGGAADGGTSTGAASTTPASSASPSSSAPVAAAAAPTTPAPTTLPPLPTPSRPVRILVAGDSTAEATGFGLAQWAGERPDLAQVSLAAEKGCGFLRGGEQLVAAWDAVPARCGEWLARHLPATVRELQPDVVMLMTTSWDVLDRRWDGGAAQTPLDDDYAGRIEADFRAVTADLLAAGAAHVVWVREPIPNVFWWSSGQAQEDPRRHAVLYAAMDLVAAEERGRVSVVDLPAWLAEQGLALDRDARPDGVHWSPEASARIARDFLGDRLLRAALLPTP